jgi:hypothetical protein
MTISIKHCSSREQAPSKPHLSFMATRLIFITFNEKGKISPSNETISIHQFHTKRFSKDLGISHPRDIPEFFLVHVHIPMTRS